jgi:hypothetical protein
VDGHETTQHLPHLELINELVGIELDRWATVRAGIPAWHPRNEGDDDGQGDAGGSGNDGGDGGTGSGDGDEGDDGAAGGSGKTYDEAYVKKLRDEAASRRTRERELEARLKELESKDLSAQEKAERERDAAVAEAAAATTKAQAALLKAEVTATAARLGAVDVDVVRTLVAADITFNDDGDPVGVEEAVTALLETKPYLKGQAGGTGTGSGAGAGNGHANRGSGLTLEKLKTMTPAEVAALPKEDVDRTLASAG